MIYITGDTHGDFARFTVFNAMTKLTEDDVMIVLGDAGLNYHRNEKDKANKYRVRRKR